MTTMATTRRATPWTRHNWRRCSGDQSVFIQQFSSRVDFKEERIVSKRSMLAWMVVGLALAAVAPLGAQAGEAAKAAEPASGLTMIVASILTAGFALGIAAGLGALGQ